MHADSRRQQLLWNMGAACGAVSSGTDWWSLVRLLPLLQSVVQCENTVVVAGLALLTNWAECADWLKHVLKVWERHVEYHCLLESIFSGRCRAFRAEAATICMQILNIYDSWWSPVSQLPPGSPDCCNALPRAICVWKQHRVKLDQEESLQKPSCTTYFTRLWPTFWRRDAGINLFVQVKQARTGIFFGLKTCQAHSTMRFSFGHRDFSIPELCKGWWKEAYTCSGDLKTSVASF